VDSCDEAEAFKLSDDRLAFFKSVRRPS